MSQRHRARLSKRPLAAVRKRITTRSTRSRNRSGTVRRRDSSRLVYGQVNESLVFIHRELAVDLARLWDALGSSSTWGEFRKGISPDRFRTLAERFADGGDCVPRDAEEFPGYDLPSVADGDYPEWPAQLMIDWVPSEIIDARYAKIVTSVFNGPFLVLDAACESAITADFRSHGFSLTKDLELVLRASGRAKPTKVVRAIPDLIQRLSSTNSQVRSDAIEMLEEAGTTVVPVFSHNWRTTTNRYGAAASTP